LNPGAGRWLVYSTSPAGSTENGLTGAAGSALPRLYDRTFAGNPPASITEPGNHLIYSFQPTLTPDSKTKVYGNNDPAQTFTGFVSDDGVTDTTTTAGLTGSIGRTVGESVGSYGITTGTLVSSVGYGISVAGAPSLTITPAALTATVANQTKVYGADDPALGTVGVTLGGLITNPAVVTWNGNVAINDSGLTSTATRSTRAVAENQVGTPNAITAGRATTTPTANTARERRGGEEGR